MTGPDERGAIGFAEKILELLDEGRYTATYKYAVLLALIDVCLERTQASGAPPEMVTTRQLAEKIVEIYWPHTMPYVSPSVSTILKQNLSGQAEILTLIQRFREHHAPEPSVPQWQSRIAAPKHYARLVRDVEWKLIEMPLPRLQIMGLSSQPFIYEIFWDQSVVRRDVAPYLVGEHSTFDNRVMLRPRIGEYLLQLSGLLRPIIQRRWAAMVAKLNSLEESQLDEFLFGAHRVQTATIRAGLWDIQDGRCFYCQRSVKNLVDAEVDHFVPWSRYPDEGLDNLVVADKRCNALKSNSLAATEHLACWVGRFAEDSSVYSQLEDLSERAGWVRHSFRSLSVARAIYLRLPSDARLWLRDRQFVPPGPAIGPTLGSP